MSLIHRGTADICPICGGDSCIGFPDRPTNSPFVKGAFDNMAQKPNDDDRCVEEDTDTDRRAQPGPTEDRARRPTDDRAKRDDEDR